MILSVCLAFAVVVVGGCRLVRDREHPEHEARLSIESVA